VQLDELTSETQRLEELVAKLNGKLLLQRKMLETWATQWVYLETYLLETYFLLFFEVCNSTNLYS